MFESLCRYTLEQYEYGFMMEDNDSKSDTCVVLIPKITPLMNTSEIQNFKKSFNPNIFVNSSETRPSLPTSISITNAVSIKKFNDVKDRDLKVNDRVICCVMNNDIRDIYLTNFI